MKKHQRYKEDRVIIIQNILAIRSLHPKMGAKKMYKLLKPEGLGRDIFIDIYTEAGFSVVTERNYRKTTNSIPSLRYKNLTSNLIINDINQLWTSDITYFQIGSNEYLYIVFIIDIYSRKILGYNVSTDLQAQSNIRALEMALNERKIDSYPNLIHHSDKGVQYTSNKYTKILEEYNIKISMCGNVYENTHIERVNGIIKNEYLVNFSIKNLAECQRTLRKSVYLYNSVRPHWSLGLKSPDNFEKDLAKIPIKDRIELKIYNHEKELKNQNFMQGELFFYGPTLE
jgi:hypothetical protein